MTRRKAVFLFAACGSDSASIQTETGGDMAHSNALIEKTIRRHRLFEPVDRQSTGLLLVSYEVFTLPSGYRCVAMRLGTPEHNEYVSSWDTSFELAVVSALRGFYSIEPDDIAVIPHAIAPDCLGWTATIQSGKQTFNGSGRESGEAYINAVHQAVRSAAGLPPLE